MAAIYFVSNERLSYFSSQELLCLTQPNKHLTLILFSTMTLSWSCLCLYIFIFMVIVMIMAILHAIRKGQATCELLIYYFYGRKGAAILFQSSPHFWMTHTYFELIERVFLWYNQEDDKTSMENLVNAHPCYPWNTLSKYAIMWVSSDQNL